MKNNGENRVIQVINSLLTAPNVPASTLESLNTICQLYAFDHVRTFIRVGESDRFVALDDARYGLPPRSHLERNGVDFEQSYYRKMEKANDETMHFLMEKRFIHTLHFEEYQPRMEQIGFIPSENAQVIEACICCVMGLAVGVMGYIVFERFAGRPYLTESEIFEVNNLCQIINDRIENFETSKQLRDEEKLNQIDALTGLPSMAVFKTRAEEKLQDDQQYVVLGMDVDKFKYINDIWSFETGNEILTEMAQVLSKLAGEGDLCCRIGDDKFAIMTKYQGDEALNDFIARLDAGFVEMQKAHFPEIKITIICGVYVVQDDVSVNMVLDKANLARRANKGSFKNVYKIYDKSLENMSDREKELEKRMTTALNNGEFVPFLQPKFNLTTNEICGAEALARWQTPERMISPAEFIPVFEKNGFITKLDFVIYEAVFDFIQKSLAKGYPVQPISLNVSRGHMDNPHFMADFLALMEKYQVPLDLIELEITESIFMEDTIALKKFISQIRDQNLRVSIDDFGTAYSSLNMLKDVEVDEVKMDKTFIDNVSRGTAPGDLDKDRIIIKNIVQMINELEFKTIFEGIETQEHLKFLKEVGCHYGQGYIFARPMPMEEFEERFFKGKGK